MQLRAAQTAKEAVKRPGVYVLFGTYSQHQADRIVTRVKTGGYPAFERGMWDATRRKDQVWVMYLGSKQS
ncbi:hypothetical protein [Streptomyces sp. NPDC002537]